MDKKQRKARDQATHRRGLATRLEEVKAELAGLRADMRAVLAQRSDQGRATANEEAAD
jgi:hypothetical protein